MTIESLWRSWKFVVISVGIIVFGLLPGLMFSTPTALGYVQLPGVIIVSLVTCLCVVCFLLCPRRPLVPKLTCLTMVSILVLITLDILKDYYLHIRYGV